MKPRKIASIPPSFSSANQAAAFWEKHSVADYWDGMEEAHFTISLDDTSKSIPLERSVASQLARLSRREKKPVGTLVNRLLKEILAQKCHTTSAQ